MVSERGGEGSGGMVGRMGGMVRGVRGMGGMVRGVRGVCQNFWSSWVMTDGWWRTGD